MLGVWGPLALGFVFGYVVFFFITLYRRFDAKTLGVTLGAIGTGAVVKLLTIGSDPQTSSQAVFSYCLGIGIGFATFGAYFLILNALYLTERITGVYFHFLLRSGGAGLSDDLDFHDLIFSVEEWSKGTLSDDEFKDVIRGLSISRTQLSKRIAKSRITATGAERDAVQVLDDAAVLDAFANVGKSKPETLKLDRAKQARDARGRFSKDNLEPS